MQSVGEKNRPQMTRIDTNKSVKFVQSVGEKNRPWMTRIDTNNLPTSHIGVGVGAKFCKCHVSNICNNHKLICVHLCHPWAISTCLSTHRHRVRHDSVRGDVQTTNATSSEKSSEKIFNLIKQKPSITVLEIATEINMSPRGVEKQIRKLRETSIIKRVGADRGGYWEIINNDEK